MEEGYESADYKLKLGAPAPDITLIKRFIRWYIHSSTGTGRLSGKKTPTVRSTQSYAERLFGGFEQATNTEIAEEDRGEIYHVRMLSL